MGQISLLARVGAESRKLTTVLLENLFETNGPTVSCFAATLAAQKKRKYRFVFLAAPPAFPW